MAFLHIKEMKLINEYVIVSVFNTSGIPREGLKVVQKVIYQLVRREFTQLVEFQHVTVIEMQY